MLRATCYPQSELMTKILVAIFLLNPAWCLADALSVASKFCELANNRRMADIVLLYDDPKVREQSEKNRMLQESFDRIQVSYRCTPIGTSLTSTGGHQVNLETEIDDPFSKMRAKRTLYLTSNLLIKYDPWWVHHPGGLDAIVAALRLQAPGRSSQDQTLETLRKIDAPTSEYRVDMNRSELAALSDKIIQWWQNKEVIVDSEGVSVSPADKADALEQFPILKSAIQSALNKEYEVAKRKGITKDGSGQRTVK